MSNQSQANAYENRRKVGYATHFCVSKYPEVNFQQCICNWGYTCILRCINVLTPSSLEL